MYCWIICILFFLITSDWYPLSGEADIPRHVDVFFFSPWYNLFRKHKSRRYCHWHLSCKYQTEVRDHTIRYLKTASVEAAMTVVPASLKDARSPKISAATWLSGFMELILQRGTWVIRKKCNPTPLQYTPRMESESGPVKIVSVEWSSLRTWIPPSSIWVKTKSISGNPKYLSWSNNWLRITTNQRPRGTLTWNLQFLSPCQDGMT